jgi:TonB family protein
MNMVAVLLGAAACTMLVTDLAAAQTYPPGTAPNLDRRVFVDVNRVTPNKVLDELAGTIACTLDVDRKLPQPDISLRLSNVRARTALDAVCDMVGCRWTLKGATLVVTATAPPPAVPPASQWLEKAKTPLAGTKWTLDRVPLRDVLAMLSQEVGADVTFEGIDPATPITEDLRGRPPMEAFVQIQLAAGCNLPGMAMRTSATSARYQVNLRCRKDTEPRREPVAAPPRVHDAQEPGLTMPKATTSVRPQYTREAMQRKVEGTVILAGVVEVDGTLRDITVTQPLDPALDERAIAAARQWRFDPGMKDGKPVPVRITLELTFSLR